jgi:hypothetical protein
MKYRRWPAGPASQALPQPVNDTYIRTDTEVDERCLSSPDEHMFEVALSDLGNKLFVLLYIGRLWIEVRRPLALYKEVNFDLDRVQWFKME